MLTDILGFDEVRPEHCLHRRVLHTVLTGEPNQPVSIDRIRRPLDPFRMELQPDLGCRIDDPCVQRGGLLGAAELPGAVLGAIDALLRHVGIELERVPVDRERQSLAGEGGQSPLHLPLADVAPRADRVRDDVDPGAGRGLRVQCFRGSGVVTTIRATNGAGWGQVIHGRVSFSCHLLPVSRSGLSRPPVAASAVPVAGQPADVNREAIRRQAGQVAPYRDADQSAPDHDPGRCMPTMRSSRAQPDADGSCPTMTRRAWRPVMVRLTRPPPVPCRCRLRLRLPALAAPAPRPR